MVVTSGHGAMQKKTEVSEEKVFETCFNDPAQLDQHQLIIVEGSSGAGKSHFIRWIDARLRNQDNPDEVVLLIRRSDNTLKGTIKQLLQIEEVKQIQNRDIYERLVKADQTISEKELKYQIFHQFQAVIQSDEDDELLNTSRRKQLYALLSNSLFEERLMESGNAIDRIFNKVTSSESGNNQDTVALFEPQDFVMDTDFSEEMQKAGADRKAQKMADWLIPDDDDGISNAQKISDYMNQHVEKVIQNCAGIEPGDFQQIFKEIRQELKRQGKRLTLLIEDITSFTGINQALLNALVTEHTGLNEADKICRLVSVVGTTTEYYKQFRDNYKDRITTQITIQDGVMGERELLQFVGKYLNVMSLEEETITEWMKNGAREDDYPVHQVAEGKHWENVLYQKQKLNLFPFTRAAVLNLYNRLGTAKTPRYIVRDLIEPAVRDMISNRSGFPAFCKGIRTGLSEVVDSRIHQLVNQIQIPEEQKAVYCERVLFLIGIWGDGTLDSDVAEEKLGGISLEVFRELGLDQFAQAVYGQSKAAPSIKPTAPKPVPKVKPLNVSYIEPEHETYVPEPAETEDPETKKRKAAYDGFYKYASKWHYDNGLFVDSLEKSGIRDAINDFIFSTINWQQEGVSLQTAAYVKNSSMELIGFANQNRGQDKLLITLENTEENFQLLLAFGKWVHLGKKSWDFDGAETAVYHATKWLVQYREKIVKAVQGEIKIPLYLKSAMILEMYRKILNGEYTYQTLNRLDAEIWMTRPSAKKLQGHSKEWTVLLDSIYERRDLKDEIQKLCVQYFNLVQGNSENSNKFILNETIFQKALHELRASSLTLTEEERNVTDVITRRDELIKHLKTLFTKLDRAAKAEQTEAKGALSALLTFFDFDEDDEIEQEDIRTILNDMLDFYRDADQYGENIRLPYEQIEKMQSQVKTLTEAISALQKGLDAEKTVDILLCYSGDPIGCVRPFLELLQTADRDADRILQAKKVEKEQLTRRGGWEDHKDPRFEKQQDEFDAMVRSFREVTGDAG
jgi:hypothetical protein